MWASRNITSASTQYMRVRPNLIRFRAVLGYVRERQGSTSGSSNLAGIDPTELRLGREPVSLATRRGASVPSRARRTPSWALTEEGQSRGQQQEPLIAQGAFSHPSCPLFQTVFSGSHADFVRWPPPGFKFGSVVANGAGGTMSCLSPSFVGPAQASIRSPTGGARREQRCG